MKLKLLWLALLLPMIAQAQFTPGVNVNGVIQENSISHWVRYLQGSNSIRLALYSDIPAVTPVSFTAFGSTPNANGASVTSNVITLQPVNGSFSGGVTPAMYNTWNAKESTLTFSTGLTRSTNTITINQAFTPTWTGLHTFTANNTVFAGVQIGLSGSGAAGVIRGTATQGLETWGITGSSNDFRLYTPAGGAILSVPTGTTNINLASLTTGLVGSTTGTLSNITALPSGTTATTQTAGNNTTLVATTAFVTTAVAGVTNYWKRTGTVLEPVTSGDLITTTSTGSNTAISGVGVNGVVVKGQATGSGSGINGVSSTGYGGSFTTASTTSAGIDVSNSSTGPLATFRTGAGPLATVANDGSISTTPQGTLYGTATGSITSAQLATSMTNETGSGSLVFATSPTLVTPVLGVATGTSLALSGALSATTGGFTSTVTIARSGNQALNLRNGTASDRMQIFVGDGTSGFTADENYILNNNTDLNVTNTGGGVQLVNGATAWSAISDENTKVMGEFKPFTDASAKVSSLRAGTTRYKTDAKGVSRSFLIAQDVQKVLPEAVSMDKNGELNLRYTEVIPLLVAAIKELEARLKVLETK